MACRMAKSGQRRGPKKKWKGWRNEGEAGPVTIRKNAIRNWWWTIAKRPSQCHNCNESIPVGGLLAFEAQEKEVLCELCADATGVSAECRESKRVREARAA